MVRGASRLRRLPIAESGTLIPGARRPRSPFEFASNLWGDCAARAHGVQVRPAPSSGHLAQAYVLSPSGRSPSWAHLPLCHWPSGVVHVAAHVSSECFGRVGEEPVDTRRWTCPPGRLGSAGGRSEPFQRSSGVSSHIPDGLTFMMCPMLIASSSPHVPSVAPPSVCCWSASDHGAWVRLGNIQV